MLGPIEIPRNMNSTRVLLVFTLTTEQKQALGPADEAETIPVVCKHLTENPGTSQPQKESQQYSKLCQFNGECALKLGVATPDKSLSKTSEH